VFKRKNANPWIGILLHKLSNKKTGAKNYGEKKIIGYQDTWGVIDPERT
jgi:hypothetical protein